MKKLRKVKKYWVAVSIGIITSALLVNNVAANEVGGETSDVLKSTTVSTSTIEKSNEAGETPRPTENDTEASLAPNQPTTPSSNISESVNTTS